MFAVGIAVEAASAIPIGAAPAATSPSVWFVVLCWRWSGARDTWLEPSVHWIVAEGNALCDLGGEHSPIQAWGGVWVVDVGRGDHEIEILKNVADEAGQDLGPTHLGKSIVLY